MEFLEPAFRVFILYSLLSVSLFCCDALHFYERILWQSLHCDGRACWEWFVEELCVHLVHGCEVVHIRKENGGFHYVGKADACFFENCFRICERLACLFLDAARCKFACCRVYGQLSRCYHESVCFDGLAFGALLVFITFIILV